MLAMIDDYEFDVSKTSYDEFESRITYFFATHQNLGGFDTYQNTGRHEEQILLKERIVEDLIKKGYGVTKNEYYNNSNTLYISISW